MANTTLPINNYRQSILDAVENNPVVIVVAETGAGKSTQVSQYLLDAGYDHVVTQPRRLAARTVAQRVAEEYGTELGKFVGFRTAHERKDSGETRCLFVTDGLAMVRELMGAGKHRVLVIDEVHEWNLNIEVLVAWTRHQIELNPDFKLVLMSATLEAERLSDFCGGAPIIDVPGRTYPVEEQSPTGREMENDVAELLRQGRNVLVFQPGKAEISETVRHLEAYNLNATIMPLHGELTSDDQQRCFRTYGQPKCVVATNVAQTSVTIPDIDAVVDSGMERRTELVEGVEGLYLRPISHADSKQRKGRAGRTKPGIYIDHCHVPWDRRPEFPKAEILRTRLDQTVLRLAEAGFDMEELRFFHQPSLSEIHDAKRTLRLLGCMDEDGTVTKIGKLVAKLPVSVQYARMIVEADSLGVVDDVITVAAILEQGEINARVCANHRDFMKTCGCWKQLIQGEKTSDVLAQLAVYRAAENLNRKEMLDAGIFAKAYYQAKEKRRNLERALKGKVKFGSSGTREDILRAICAGMIDHLYVREYGSYRNGDGMPRSLNRESVIASAPDFMVGLPWDLEVKSRNGTVVLNLVRMASRVEPGWLVDVAPQLAELRDHLDPSYVETDDAVYSTTQLVFNGMVVQEFRVADPTHPEAVRLLQQGRNDRQWTQWADRPAIAIPDPTDASSSVPDVAVHVYGHDVETGQPLEAYGTLKPNYRRWSDERWFEVHWTRDKAEADVHRQQAVTYFQLTRERAMREAELRRIENELSEYRTGVVIPLRDQLWDIVYGSDASLLDDETLRRVREVQSAIPAYATIEDLQRWVKRATAMEEEVGQKLAKSKIDLDAPLDLSKLQGRFNQH